jgi:two-component sensor histidine kinase
VVRDVIVMYATAEDLERRAQDTYRKPDGRDTVVSAPGTSAGDDVSQPLEHRPEAAGAARAITSEVLEGWHVGPEPTQSVLLVVSELVTNAVEHALPPVTLHLHRERAGSHVWVGVTDGGLAHDEGEWASSCTQEEHGRGLAVVEVLATSHGISTHLGNTATHWARLSAHEAAG